MPDGQFLFGGPEVDVVTSLRGKQKEEAASRWGGDTASEASGNLPIFRNF